MQNVLKQIRYLANSIAHRQFMYDMRCRLNSDSLKVIERAQWARLQSEEFFELKDLYVKNREALLQCTNLTKDDKDTFRSLDICVSQDLEREFEL